MRTRILYFYVGNHSGGPIISLIQLLNNLDYSKFEPYVICVKPTHNETLIALKKNKNIKIIELDIWINNWLVSASYRGNKGIWHFIKTPGRILRMLHNSWVLRKLIVENKIDIVHSNFELAIEGAVASKIARIPHIWHLRAPVGKKGAVKFPLGQYLGCVIISFFSTQIIVNSRATFNSIRSYVRHGKVNLIYNGINLSDFEVQNQSYFRLKFQINQDLKIIASLGYFSALKGGEEFIETAIATCKKAKDVVFIWIGSYDTLDEYYSQLYKKVIKACLSERIIFVGEQYEIPEILMGIDILLQPMKYGSWSRVVIEAMAASIPVVAIEPELNSEFINHDQNGLLAMNFEEASKYILKLKCDKYKRQILGKQGNEFVKKNLTNSQTTGKISELYESLTKRGH